MKEDILNSAKVRTDATTVETNGVQTYIRSFSATRSALYVGAEKKNPETRREMRILKEFSGTLIHDHETALCHFGTGYGECNVHLERYLKKSVTIQSRQGKGRRKRCLKRLSLQRRKH